MSSGASEIATGPITAVVGILSLESVILVAVMPKGECDTVAGNATGSNTPNTSMASGAIVSLLGLVGTPAFSVASYPDTLTTAVAVSVRSFTPAIGNSTLCREGISPTVHHAVHIVPPTPWLV